MKDSKEYSKQIQKLYRALKHKYPKPEKPQYDEPVDALVYAVICENLSEAQAQATIKKLSDYFVDSNDLRVSLTEEIIEIIGEDTPAAKTIALDMTKILAAVFEKYNTVTLEAVKKLGKRPAKQILEKFEGVTPFVVDYCMLTSLQGHAIPLTQKMIEFLKDAELVHPEADHQEIEGFLSRQISAKNAFEFYYMLRLESDCASGRKKKKTSKKTRIKTKTKTKAKTKRKTKTKMKK